MNYRKLYAEYFNIEIPSEYDIHHIDFDKNNNDIKNLLLLPKDLHRRLHVCFERNGAIDTANLFQFLYCGNPHASSLISGVLLEVVEIYKEVTFWASCKKMEIIYKQGGNILRTYSYKRFRK